MAKLVLTAIGDDRAGLVSALAGAVADQGGNWLESQMARLAGKFAGIVLVEVPNNLVEQLRTSVASLGVLEVAVTPVADEGQRSGASYGLHLLGDDRPGIVREVAQALAANGATIDELHTQAFEAPWAGGQLFEANAVVRVPEDTDLDAIRAALEAIAHELMVELELHPTE